MDNHEYIDLINAQKIDLAATELNYEKFRLLAKNNNITAEERIGFPTEYRLGFENDIIKDITNKLDDLSINGGSILDIGCGASPLTYELVDVFRKKNLNIYLIDSQEMLQHIPSYSNVTKIAGLFPQNYIEVNDANKNGFDYILCYSVLHYIFLDANIFHFFDTVVSLLKPGGIALIGDIPNVSKRKRFFASTTGQEFHKQFMQTNENPEVKLFEIQFNKIDDGVLAGIIQRMQNFGCDAYLVPQAKNLPMQNRREDLIIRKI